LAKAQDKSISKILEPSNTSYIFKSLSSIRSIVSEFKLSKSISSNRHTKKFLSYEPVLFQETIHGENIRAHVIKKKVIAIRIKSQRIDYRYDDSQRKFELIELPKKISDECVILSEQAQLPFCGIDLIVYNGQYFLLEINPSPGYVFFENEIKDKCISHALTEALIA
jgi:glutathione synthase/RimK-type ligase-like ATP-grasp enzyme